MQGDVIEAAIMGFILSEFLPGEEPRALTDDVKLVSHGILDSIASLRLVDFLEQEFEIAVAAHEMGPEHMDRLSDIAALVRRKLEI